MIPVDNFSESWLADIGIDAVANIQPILSPPRSAAPASRRKSTAPTSVRKTPKQQPLVEKGEEDGLPPPPSATAPKSTLKARASAAKASLLAAAGKVDQGEANKEAGAAEQAVMAGTPPHYDMQGLASPPAPSHMGRRRRSSGNSLPATPILQSALKKGMAPRTPSLKRVSFTGSANSGVTVVPRYALPC